jgi:hypothetical protein
LTVSLNPAFNFFNTRPGSGYAGGGFSGFVFVSAPGGVTSVVSVFVRVPLQECADLRVDNSAQSLTSGSTPFAIPVLASPTLLCNWYPGALSGWISTEAPYLTTTSALYRATPNTGPFPRFGSVRLNGQVTHITQPAVAAESVFEDAQTGSMFGDYIYMMRLSNITVGCSFAPRLYCPDATITREQMAVFIIRAALRTDDFPFPLTPYFTDVSPLRSTFKYVQKLRELGITTGCTPGGKEFCPGETVTRGQMAVFIMRGRFGETFADAPGATFSDVPPSHGFFRYIQSIKTLGITSGCSATQFCPDAPTTRAQMAAFIVRAFLSE